LIHSSVVGHLGHFQGLVVNSAAVNMGVKVALSLAYTPLHICPGMGSLDHMVGLLLVF
jgi:hypothetical protein